MDLSDMHVGRSLEGNDLEQDCKCPKADCGLVAYKTIDQTCGQHGFFAGKTLRQLHKAADCTHG